MNVGNLRVTYRFKFTQVAVILRKLNSRIILKVVMFLSKELLTLKLFIKSLNIYFAIFNGRYAVLETLC